MAKKEMFRIASKALIWNNNKKKKKKKKKKHWVFIHDILIWIRWEIYIQECRKSPTIALVIVDTCNFDDRYIHVFIFIYKFNLE